MKIFLLILLLPFLTLANTEKNINCNSFKVVILKGTENQKFDRFVDVYWKYNMQEYPEWATYVGFPGKNHLWTDNSDAALERRLKDLDCQLKYLKQIQIIKLNEVNQLSFKLLQKSILENQESYKYGDRYLVLNHMNGVHIDVPDILFSMPKKSKSDFEDMLKRLDSVPVLVGQVQSRLEQGSKLKITPVQLFLQKVPAQFKNVLTDDLEKSPLYEPFVKLPDSWTLEEKENFRKRAKVVIKEKAYPAFQKLLDYLTKTYIPGARTETAMTSLPNGKDWYNFRVRAETTTNLSSDELHELGLKEVERISALMNKLIAEIGFKGSIQDFNKKLLNDSKYYFATPKELMMAYRDFAKRVDAEMPTMFGKLPRNTYGIREMPSYKAANAPTAYYQGGSLTAGRAGYFEANTYNLKARPSWGIEALTLHEAVPGHHLQISIAQEIENLPDFRKNSGHTAYIEGWALYAESLGFDMGFYTEPESRYGAYIYEMWRAVRLVVDTGMHAKGWSREKALLYFENWLPKSRTESEVEIDRYITWPAQALAYKVGQLKILELRKFANEKLGDHFSIRKFHDEVLRHGSLPMDILDEKIRAWVVSEELAQTMKR
jgi:uncharacterized protein (DUF885 family)